jgi:hypothetical protein
MAEVESSATVVPLKPTPGKAKPREPSARRSRAKRPRKRPPTDSLPTASSQTAAATDSPSQVGLRLPERGASSSRVLAFTVFGIGLLTAAVGLYLNASFLWKFGRTSDARLVLAIVGLVTDIVTLVLPAAAVSRRRHCRRFVHGRSAAGVRHGAAPTRAGVALLPLGRREPAGQVMKVE